MWMKIPYYQLQKGSHVFRFQQRKDCAYMHTAQRSSFAGWLNDSRVCKGSDLGTCDLGTVVTLVVLCYVSSTILRHK